MFQHKWMKSTAALLCGIFLSLGATLFTGCPKKPINCAGGTTLCGTDCFDLQADSNNCGTCGEVCSTDQVCQTGCCQPGVAGHNIVAACLWTHEVVGIQSDSLYVGALAPFGPVGSTAAALAQMGPAILVADGQGNGVYELDGVSFVQGPETLTVGGMSTQMLTDAGTLYVLNSENNSLDVLQTTGPTANGGLGLVNTGALAFGDNTDPVAMALNGTDLWVAFYGGIGSDAGYLPGQKVVRVPVGDPTSLAVADTIDLTTLNLYAFDGGSPIPRPTGMLIRNGALYVALNNLDSSYRPAGDGVLARIDLTSKAVTTLDLGADVCINAGALAILGTGMVVSCSGQVLYDNESNALGSDRTGVMLLGPGDDRIATWGLACPAGTIADGGCIPPSAGRLAVKNNRVFVGDYSTGNLYVIDLEGAQFVERRGYAAAADAGTSATSCAATQFGPMNICPPGGEFNQANVSDILTIQ